MRLALALLLAAAAALVLPSAAAAATGACVVGTTGGPACEVWQGKVARIVDADTLDVDLDDDGVKAPKRIRFIGAQAMEQTVYTASRRRGECHAVDATRRVEDLVERSRGRVRLAAQDPASVARRRLQRTVAVRIDGRWRDVGTILMREGRALWWPGWTEWAPNASYSRLLQRAIATRRGLFDPAGCGEGPSPAAPLRLWVNWDESERDPDGEWVKVHNPDPVTPLPLGGWYLRDAGLLRYTFPSSAVVPPGGTVTLNVGDEAFDATEFAWGLAAPIFTDPTSGASARGDGAYLFDPLGNVRAAMVFPCRTGCADPLQGAVRISVAPRWRRESVTLVNQTQVPVDLHGHVLKSRGRSYHFPAGAVIPPGASMRIGSIADPAADTALDKGWGQPGPFLRDAGGTARLLTYSDVTLACAAWGDGAC